ncbi:MAG: VTT domain-containing protein [Chloroflexota bacterium]|jgi:membrane protein DedA with SNARE-associated domain
METALEILQGLWLNFQQGQLPDLGTWNYMLVAFFMLFQGRMSAVFGGVAAAAGYLNLLPIILVALLARLIVDLFWYNVGSTGQIDRIGHRFGFYRSIAGHVEEGVQMQPQRFILIAKLSNGLSLPAVVAAGNARVPYRQWLPASFMGEFVWTLPLLLLGYFATDKLAGLQGGISYLTIGLTTLFLLFFLFTYLRTKRAPTSLDSR